MIKPIEVDTKLRDTLINVDRFNEFNNFEVNSYAQYKHNQTVVFEDINLGFITRNQREIIAVYEDKNGLLGRFIGESDIRIEHKACITVPSYNVVSIRFYLMPNMPYIRSLGKILLLAGDQLLQDNEVVHHKLHPMINMYNAVENVMRAINSSEKPDLRHESQCFDYIKNDLLKTDDVGYANFEHNIRVITNSNTRRRGFYVSGLNPAEVFLEKGKLDHIKIEVSKI